MFALWWVYNNHACLVANVKLQQPVLHKFEQEGRLGTDVCKETMVWQLCALQCRVN